MEQKKYLSVVDYIRQRDKKRDGNAIVTELGNGKITRNEYWDLVEHYKRYFISQGFFYGCGKPVVICNENVPEYEFMYMALLELGAIVSTVSLSFFKSNVVRHTIIKGADTIILSAEYITPELKSSLESLKNNKYNGLIKRIIFTSKGEYRSAEEKAVYENNFNFKKMIDSLDLPKNIEIVYNGEIAKKGNDNKIIFSEENQNIDLSKFDATYSNTGGTTTGIPNCAVHTHEAIIKLLEAHEEDVYPEFPVREGNKALLLIPISHITSQFYALLLRRASGANIIYNPGAFAPAEITKALIEDEINDVIAPFGLYMAVANSPLKKGDLKHLRPSCGGEPTPKGPTKLVNERLVWAGAEPIVIGGGSTEFGSAFMTTYGVKNRSNETGVLIPGAEAKIINPKDWKETKEGERGLIYARCGWQMKEYLNNEKATKEFFNYTDEEGKVWGTNNDIGSITGKYNNKPVYSMDGRVTDFVLQDKKSKRYYPGITFTNGKIDSVDLSQGNFLFDMRDKILNIPGIIEAEALLIPYDDNDKSGTPVVNLVVVPQVNPVDIIKAIYSQLLQEEFVPEGLIFRTNFARSLATDKRETVTLKEERGTYYSIDSNGNITAIVIPKSGEPIHEVVDNLEIVQRVAPPEPRKILVRQD